MIKVCLFLPVVLLLISCSPKKEGPNLFISPDPNITSDNFADSLLKKVKHYSYEPYYFLEIKNILGCTFEILVNDVPTFKFFQEDQVSAEVDVQLMILKSGPQKITYKLYPIGKRENGDVIDKLPDWTEVDLNILKINKKKVDPYMTKEVVLEHHSLKKPDGKTFIAADESYYEHSFTFNAQVPYENKGWSNSKDLRKMDQKELLQKTAAAYQQVWNLINDKKTDDYFKLTFHSQVEIGQSGYIGQQEIEDVISDELFPFKESSYKIEPLENYKMVLYGDGKLVCLELNSSDPRLRKEYALWGKYKNESGNTRARFTGLYLHIPEGKTGFEVIR